MTWEIRTGDCTELLGAMESNSIHSIVTDPPAGIGFMGKDWDKDKGGRDSWIAWMTSVAVECNRVLRPGGHALVWALPRTSHWTATAWEDAGFQVRDRIAHVFGTGFPKSLDLGKQAALGDDWQGYGTALKPAVEDWWVFRKPLIGTVAANVLEHGTGALSVDACRVRTTDRLVRQAIPRHDNQVLGGGLGSGSQVEPLGRFPPHLLLTHPDCQEVCSPDCPVAHLDKSAKFFPAFRYQAKPSAKEKSAGLEHRNVSIINTDTPPGTKGARSPRAGAGRNGGARNPHPTVKPIELMRWLCRLVTPPSGTVLDPFTGSGTTGCAAVLEGFDFIGFEQSAEFAEVARDRIAHWSKHPNPSHSR